MALINNRAQIIEDGWSYPDGEANDRLRPHYIVPFEILSAAGLGTEFHRPLGALVTAGVVAEQIAPFLDKLDLVVIEFPKFRDGRGFTVARTLRGRYGFRGDIRAIGHILPDQFAALVQCGFTSIVTPSEHPPEQWVQDETRAGTSMNAGPLLQRLIGRRTALPAVLGEDSTERVKR